MSMVAWLRYFVHTVKSCTIRKEHCLSIYTYKEYSMQSLREVLEQARANRVAVGHFNISTMETLHAIFDAARAEGQPVIIGVSEGERAFFGTRQAAAAVRSLREQYDYPIFMNADHTHDVEGIAEALAADFDSVMIDGSRLNFDENVALTSRCVDMVRAHTAHTGRDILVEAELGYIGTSSAILDSVPEGALDDRTSPDVAARFVAATGVDIFAPSVGNVHGIVTSGNPHIEVPRVRDIARATSAFLVLHGGSGISDADIVAGIAAGITIVHVNTELRVAFRAGVERGLAADPAVAPYKFLQPARDAVYDVVRRKIRLFAKITS